MLRRGVSLALTMLLVGPAGCSTEKRPSVPVECKAGRGAIRTALREAPDPVRLEGVPLSACLTTSSDTADIAEVGTEYVAVTADLAEQTRRDPRGPAAMRLGYMVGAVRKGADATQGVNDEIVRRVEQELLTVDTRSAAYRRGERAGRDSG